IHGDNWQGRISSAFDSILSDGSIFKTQCAVRASIKFYKRRFARLRFGACGYLNQICLDSNFIIKVSASDNTVVTRTDMNRFGRDAIEYDGIVADGNISNRYIDVGWWIDIDRNRRSYGIDDRVAVDQIILQYDA